MDHFTLIQSFFTKMQCPHCGNHLTENGVELIREEKGFYLVSVHCHHCETHVGVAMVGVEHSMNTPMQVNEFQESLGALPLKRRYRDPELTPDELERLSNYEPIKEDDVLEAHDFIQGLGRDWQKHIPKEMLERCTEPDMEHQET